MKIKHSWNILLVALGRPTASLLERVDEGYIARKALVTESASQNFFIINPASGHLLTINDTVCDSGTPLIIDLNQTDAWQKWVINQDNTIESLHCPGMVVDIQGSGCPNGAMIVIAPKVDSLDRQVWTRREDGVIWNANCNTQALDINTGVATPGQGIILWGIHGGLNQRWELILEETSQPTAMPTPSPSRRSAKGMKSKYIKENVFDSK
ncbi:hypothetical protein HJC23_006101 [Cyclotella cryptica]|uniref:Ricin B lectin domain-containing protein n=1 Tax=Cyclotella cryptica TaxID=29204 RepID=A0ABD3QKY3_9STRA|eukprot:CCRYP_004562-RA/>CCRYP_004562-RA protein AED:0.00 eAED:0.00 QI:184/1/1/1/1/1/2/107/209